MAKYDFISATEVQGLIPVMKDGKWGLVSYDDYDEKIVEPRWDSPPREEKYGFIKILNKEKEGLFNSSGKEIVPVIYEHVFVETEHRIVAERIDDKYAIFNGLGLPMISFKKGYSCLDYFSDDRIIAYKNGKGGIIDINENEIIPFVYDGIFWDQTHEFYTVEKEGLTGVINTNGKEIVPCTFNDIYLLDDYIIVKIKDSFGVVGYDGNDMIPCKYKYLNDARENRFIFKEHDRYGYGIMDINGKYIVKPKYYAIEPFVQGFAKVTDEKGRKGIIDVNGEIVCEAIYEDVGNLVDRFAAVKHNNRWGVINELGVECIPTKYKEYKRLSMNLIAVYCDNDKWRIISVSGFEKTPAIYDSIKPGQGDQIVVTINGMEGILNL